MERSRIEVVESAPIAIEVLPKTDGVVWVFKSKNQEQRISSIYELLEVVRAAG
ncbi:MAG: hypothetical protein AAGI23_00620 [Bacteroidota bacterium]